MVTGRRRVWVRVWVLWCGGATRAGMDEDEAYTGRPTWSLVARRVASPRCADSFLDSQKKPDRKNDLLAHDPLIDTASAPARTSC